jgi:hypothetical protein
VRTRQLSHNNNNSVGAIMADIIILLRIYPLLGNDSLNTFPLEPTRETIGRLLLVKGSVNKPS